MIVLTAVNNCSKLGPSGSRGSGVCTSASHQLTTEIRFKITYSRDHFVKHQRLVLNLAVSQSLTWIHQ